MAGAQRRDDESSMGEACSREGTSICQEAVFPGPYSPVLTGALFKMCRGVRESVSGLARQRESWTLEAALAPRMAWRNRSGFPCS